MRRYFMIAVIILFACGFLWGAQSTTNRLLSGLLCAMIPLAPYIVVLLLKRTGHYQRLESRFLDL